MTKTELIAALLAITEDPDRTIEQARGEADRLLLEYVDDVDVTRTYEYAVL